jgi:hypothetical protein
VWCTAGAPRSASIRGWPRPFSSTKSTIAISWHRRSGRPTRSRIFLTWPPSGCGGGARCRLISPLDRRSLSSRSMTACSRRPCRHAGDRGARRKDHSAQAMPRAHLTAVAMGKDIAAAESTKPLRANSLGIPNRSRHDSRWQTEGICHEPRYSSVGGLYPARWILRAGVCFRRRRPLILDLRGTACPLLAQTPRIVLFRFLDFVVCSTHP